MAAPNPASQLLANASVRHQVFLERLKRGQSRKAQAFLVEMDRALRLRIGATEFQRGRIEAQLSGIAADLRAIRGRADTALLSEMRDVAEYEAGFEIRALGTITTNFTVAAPTQVYAAALSKPLSLRGPGGGKLIEPFVRGWSETMVTNTIDTIRQGFFEGQTNAAILQAIRGTTAARNEDGLLARMSRSEEALVRTVVQHMASVAREEVWQANDDLVTGVQWLSVLDDRTTTVCQSLSGQIFPLDSGPRPPIHINCLTGDTMVSTCSTVANIYKRAYKGAAVNITTKAGRTLCITPNHPILTLRGWVAAGEINRSDKLIPVDALKISIDKHYEDSVDAEFAELFGAADVLIEASSISNRPTTAEDFHGDGITDSEVEVITTDGLGWGNIVKVLGENIKHKRLKLGAAIDAPFSTLGPPAMLGLFDNAATHCVMSLLGKVGDLLRRRASHAGELLRGPASQVLAALNEHPLYWFFPRAVQPKMRRYATDTDTGLVSCDNGVLFDLCEVDKPNAFNGYPAQSDDSKYRLIADSHEFANPADSHLFDCSKADDVVDLFVSEIDTHVYNLENSDNWYTANGIITHNCRSSTTPAIDPKFAFLSKNAQQSSLFGPVDAKETYYSWLKKQDAGFQDEAIGPMRAKLLRDGGLSAERFAELNIGKNYNPLTLERMREIEPLAFERAGL